MNEKTIEEITENDTLQDIIDRYDEHRRKSSNLAYITALLFCTIVGLPFSIYTFIKSYQHEKEYKRIAKECFVKSLEGKEKEKYEKICQYIKSKKKWYDFF